MLRGNEKVHKYLIETKLNSKMHEFCRKGFKNERRLPLSLSKNQIGKKQKVEMRTSTVTFDYKILSRKFL